MFADARKRNDEWCTKYASRTASYFSYYMEARKVEDLTHLLVADNVNSRLNEECLGP
ncbi:hypothetical protein HPB47_006573, partial [Ixodes persulcatus]